MLADRTEASLGTDSRNGVGKSTLVEIVNYILGSNLGGDQSLSKLKGTDWSFSLDLTINEVEFTASRSLDFTSVIQLEGDFRALDLELDPDERSTSLKKWKRFLGAQCFGLTEDTISDLDYVPSFRALIAFFMRSGRGAFIRPFETRSGQLRWQTQVYNSYLLRLNWRLASEWQRIRDERKTLSALGSRADREIEKYIGSVGELESERVVLTRRISDLQEAVSSFNVIPEYREIQNSVNEATFALQRLVADNNLDARLIERYQDRLESETAASTTDIAALYAELNVTLSDAVLRSLQEVQDFHAQITENRKLYLQGEIERLQGRYAEREAQILSLSTERSARMDALSSGGALDEFTRIQMTLVQAQSELESLDRRIDDVARIRRGRAQLNAEERQLESEAIRDHEERRGSWTEAIDLFTQFTTALYDSPGSLVVVTGASGYEFRTAMDKAGSHGQDNMAIFCYDLVLSAIWDSGPVGPGILVHDSEMFDPVDERQVARALALAKERSETSSAPSQYIALLNSDTLPIDELASLSIDIEEHVKMRLGDRAPEESLLGVKF